MIYQIAGLILTVTAAVCGTVYAVFYTKTKAHAERVYRAQRIAATRSIVENGLHAMYEQERALRIAAETTVNTKEFIINQKDKEIERLKGSAQTCRRERSVMYICLHCGHEFEDIAAKNYDSSTGTWEEYCPNCGSEDFEEAEKCEKCGEWHSADNVENGVCEDCIDKASTVPNAFAYGDKNKWCVELNGFLAWAFTAEEINSILLNELMKNKDLADKYARDYCKDDTWSFADYLKKEEDK